MTEEVDHARNYREWLTRSLYAWLEWRGTHAQDHPEDRPSVQCAAALYAAARAVEELPADDPRLLRLTRLYGARDEAVHEFLEQECGIIARHGFGSVGTQTTDELLSALVKAADDAVLLSLESALSSQGDNRG
jgi:hypothetical protein